ncbi:putative surface protein with fasciclin (FAS1) repeats [Gelidibacter algens]|uniref:Putative surface protein with fasciclin (FAS1) repeats n=1 Tax=Gelidibacter algens TaxID=49280 RepID=A0A1A7R100_9FLAO|nr:fasciclin domain-containing protein [Gelidibacter algens]OBX25930.1 beta-Ig-H3/fasciclin [Gelidibacter algens]RAJ25269.1 putative surface protein with fasciclin (FAS1) repeats [Gelidibacter algens]
MKIISKTFKILPLLLLLIGLQSCSNDDDNNAPQEMDIVQTAIASPDLTSLVAALQAADGNLVSVLSGPGPFTVLAPTNAAFQKFLTDNGFARLSDVPTDVLSQILLNHVITGNVPSSALVTAGSGYAKTSATGPGGKNLSLYFNTSDGVQFNGISEVVAADIMATNGTIHVVDAVIGLPTVVDFALANPALSSLVAALQSADSQTPSPNLIPTLQGDGPFTVFAPTNDAFGALLTELGAASLGAIPPATVQAVLTYHVVSGNVTSDMIPTGTVPTLGGNVTLNASNLTITDANNRVSNIIPSLVDIQAINGVVHAIDKVILPPQ